MPSLEEQVTNAVMGGPEDAFGEEEALQCVEKKLIKESDPAHSLGGTSQVRRNGAGMAHTQPGIGASPGASCVGTLIHADIQQQINDCAR